MYKKLIFLISVSLIIFQIKCFEFDELPQKIGLSIDSVGVNSDTVFIRSKLDFISTSISEHGYCWTTWPEIPILYNAQYTCNGPLRNSEFFEEKIVLGNGNYFFRAFIINDSLVEYSMPRYIKVLVND